MAALFYLPRLYVYHAENIEKKEFVGVVKIMERKLYKFIGVPAFYSTILSGLGLLWVNSGIFSSGSWIYVKIILVIMLSAYFFHLGKIREVLHDDKCKRGGKFFRAYNEVPTLILIAVVILVIIKPF